MEVQMPDRLARIRAAIRHYAEALGKAELLHRRDEFRHGHVLSELPTNDGATMATTLFPSAMERTT